MNKIKHFLFDFDDTLISTRQIYYAKFYEVYKILELTLSGADQNEIKKDFEAINNMVYKTHGVNPKRWHVILDKFIKLYPSVPKVTVEECHQTLMQIYTTVPELKPGAIESLRILRNSGFGLGIVTHSWDELTFFKLEKTGLREFFNEFVYVADMSKEKDFRSWTEAVSKFSLRVEQVGVVGDSPKTDMRASREAGIKHQYYIKDPNQWIMLAGKLPKGTHVLEHGINDLIPVLKLQGVL